MEIHFINVGCGNMTLLLFNSGATWLYDCNVTDENQQAVLGYLRRAMGQRRQIQAFICSHRDADHMRGIKIVHRAFPLGGIWDNGVEGTTTDSPEYREYMDLRRQLQNGVISAGTETKVGEVVVLWLNSQDTNLTDANDQSIVAKVDFTGSSCLLTGDTSCLPWKNRITRSYGARLKSSILLASHHGSMTFFRGPNDTTNYTAHIEQIRPAMTVISVGPNVHGLPDAEAVRLYEHYSSGADNGAKLFRTDKEGNMKLELLGRGAWRLNPNQS